VDQFLQSLDSQLSKTDRDSDFGLAWSEGMRALSEAQELEGNERQEKLVQSCDKFIMAIQYGRSRPEPFLGMAYLLTILEDYHSAGKYVRIALRLAPDFPEALDLNRLIDTCSVVSNAFADLSELCMIAGVRMEEISPETANLNLKDLYTKTETLLYTQQQLLDYEPAPEIIVRSEELAELEHRSHELQAFSTGIRQRLDILVKEYDVQKLVAALEKIEALAQYYAKSLKISRQLAEMSEWVKQDFKLLTRHIIQLRMHSSAESVARAEQFDAELDARYQKIVLAIQELDEHTRERFEDQINFEHLDQQRTNFQQLLDATRRRVHMPHA